LSGSSENQIIDCQITDNKDGDIIMNKFSKNNKIINNDDLEDRLNNLKLRIFEIFQNIISRFSKVKNNQILSHFEY
jgi:hypothetical protein